MVRLDDGEVVVEVVRVYASVKVYEVLLQRLIVYDICVR